MRVLVTGAYGFIGSHVVGELMAAGHRVLGGVRRARLDAGFPAFATITCDMARDRDESDWLPRLAGIDAVVNCAGILRERPGEIFDAVHVDVPLTLFRACARAGVRRVIQVSVIGNNEDGAFVASKHRCDAQLASLDLDWVILRPSVVYSVRGSLGGTSLLRALSALPKVILLPGNGAQRLQPIAVEDVGAIIVAVLSDPKIVRETLDLVGPHILTLRDYLLAWRHWLGFGGPREIRVPIRLAHFGAWCGEKLGTGPLGVTMWRMLERGNIGEENAVQRLGERFGFMPRTLQQALAEMPSQVQDHWHARLYFLLPILRVLVAFLWLASGLVGLLMESNNLRAMTASGPLSADAAVWLGRVMGMADMVLGGLLLVRWRSRLILGLMLAMLIGYTIGIGSLWPGQWLDPLGGLLKNFPLMAVLGLLLAVEKRK